MSSSNLAHAPDWKKRSFQVILPVAVLFLFLHLVGCSGKSEEPGRLNAAEAAESSPPARESSPPREGSWVEVRRGEICKLYPAVGMFRAQKITRLGSQVNGRVQEVLVDVGDPIRKGQELLKLDDAFFQIEVAQRTADIDAARVAQDDAQLNLNRMKNLWEKPEGKEPSVPRKLFDDAKTRFEGARARLRQAEESLRNAGERLKESTIRAPYDGVVARRLVDPGEPVTSTPITSLLEVQDITTLDLEFSLPQEMLSRVRKGTDVTFEVEGIEDGSGKGKISVIYPAIDEKTRSFRCRVQVMNESLKYRPGLLVQVRVVDRKVADALLVPARALSRTGSGWEVSVQVERRPERRPVQVGLRTEDRVEVREGLVEGDKVWLPR